MKILIAPWYITYTQHREAPRIILQLARRKFLSDV